MGYIMEPSNKDEGHISHCLDIARNPYQAFLVLVLGGDLERGANETVVDEMQVILNSERAHPLSYYPELRDSLMSPQCQRAQYRVLAVEGPSA